MPSLRFSSDDPTIQAREYAAWYKDEVGAGHVVVKPRGPRVEEDLPAWPWNVMVAEGLVAVQKTWTKNPSKADLKLVRDHGARFEPVKMFEMVVV